MTQERPILVSGAMMRALLAGRAQRSKLYAPQGVAPDALEHLAKRLANGLDHATDGQCWEWQRTTNDDGYG